MRRTGIALAVLAAGCARAAPVFLDLPSPGGTFALDAGPVADGDSSVFEILEEAGGAWGRWIRFGDHPVVVLTDVRFRGDTVTLTAAMGAGPARVMFVRRPDNTLAGEWARGNEHHRFTGRRRSEAVSAEFAALARTPRFGPGVISTDSGESFGTFTPDGLEIIYTRHRADWSHHRLVWSRFDGTRWTDPVTLPFSGSFNDREPKLSPDGRRLFFSSNRPATPGGGQRRDLDIWVVDRAADGSWGEPRHLGEPINTAAQEFCPVLVADGSLYFISTRIGGTADTSDHHNVWRARFVNGAWSAPEPLGAAINGSTETNVYVTPDEQLMLVSRDGAPDGFGGDDLYISEKRGGEWTPMRHLLAPINTWAYEYGPLVTPDGHGLLFTSARRGTPDLYRVDLGSLR